MAKVQIEFLLQVVERAFRIFAVLQQRLAVFDHAYLLRLAISFDPAFEHRIDFVQLLLILRMEAVKEIIFFASRDKLFERLVAIFRECKLFPERNFLGIGIRRQIDKRHRQ